MTAAASEPKHDEDVKLDSEKGSTSNEAPEVGTTAALDAHYDPEYVAQTLYVERCGLLLGVIWHH